MPQITITISRQAYPKLKREGVEIAKVTGYEMQKKVKPVVNKSPRTVRNLKTEIGFIVISPIMKFTACLVPTFKDNTELIKENIKKMIDYIRKESKCKDEEMNAVIYGGIAYDSSEPISEKCYCLVDTLEEACEDESITPTIITGLFNNKNAELNSYVREKNVTFWGDLFNDSRLSPTANSEEIQNELKEHCEYVKIAPNCTLKFIEKLPHKTNYLAENFE